MKHAVRCLVSAGVLAPIVLGIVRAQETPASPADDAPLEQSIYIPYEKLWKVFEQQGRGVFISYEQFQELWDAQLDRQPRVVDEKPPVDALVSEVSGTATVGKDVVEFDAGVTIEVLKQGWTEVPLHLEDVAMIESTIDGKPARLRFDPATGYSILIEHEGPKSAFHDLRIRFGKSYTKTPGRNSVGFRSPPAPVSRWDIRIAEPGVKVDVFPLLAATDAPTEPGDGGTRVLAFLGAAPDVRFEWTPAAEGARGLEALANVRMMQSITIEEGVSRTRAELTYEITRTELANFALEAPTGQKVVNVFDANVREWTVRDADGAQRIEVQLFEPARGTQGLVVELETFGEQANVVVPVLRALGVGRQQGVLAVRLGAGLRAEVTSREGLLQVDTRDLPPTLETQQPDFAYRYGAVPFTLALDVEKIRPEIIADSLVEVHIRPEEILVDIFAGFDVRRAGVFQFVMELPPDFEVRDVTGAAHEEYQAAQIDRHFVEEGAAGSQRLVTALTNKAEGKTGLAVRLRRSLQEPDLLSPTGRSVELDFALPQAVGDEIVRDGGRLAVYGPESLIINPAAARGLRQVSHSEAVAGMRSTLRSGTERPVISYSYAQDDASLTIEAERRAPHVTVRQFLVTTVEAGVVKYRARFFYDILYSGVKSLRLDLPEAEAEAVRLTTPGLRWQEIDAEDVAPGASARSIAGETEFFGAVQVELRWEEKLAELDVGKSVDIPAPRIVPRDVDRAWGQIALVKSEAIDVAPTEARKGLRPIDPRYDLMPGADAPDAAAAFEFHDDWELTVRATRYEPTDVKASSIERGWVRIVLTRGHVASVQAIYRVVSARQRLLVRLPEAAEFDTQPLRISGRPVALEQGSPGEYFVPLVGLEQGAPFLIELRYIVPGRARGLRGPEFPMEPAMQQVFLSAHVPEEHAYAGSRGPWDEELVWAVKGFGLYPRSRRSVDELVGWVVGDIEADRDQLLSFATDGRHLCFSTLRPPAEPAGALRLFLAPYWLLNGFVLVVIVAIGISLLSAPLGRRAIAVGGWLIALALAAVFAPSLARSLVSNAGMAAGVIVLIVWGVWYLVVLLPRSPLADALHLASEQRRAEATAQRRQEPPPPKPSSADGDSPSGPRGKEDRGGHA